ncbi:MAG: T9SS type A sorting domain-containing protein, partial [bacterium]
CNFTIRAYAPIMSVVGKSVSDIAPGGDGDGFVEPGEVATITVSTRNSGGERAKTVRGTITSLSSYVDVVNGISNFGDIMSDSTKQGTPSFTVRINSSTPNPTNVSVELTLTNSLAQVVKDTIRFMVGSGGFFDDVEAGSGSWSATNWHITEWRANSPTHSWYLGRELFHTYLDTTTYILITPTFFLLPNSYLTFWHLYATEIGYDTCYVHIKYGTSSWIRLGAFNGMSRVFRFASYDLSSIPAGSECQVRFMLVSDPRVRNEGWFIDDIYVGPPVDGELGAGDVYPPAGDTVVSYKFRVTYVSLRSIEATTVSVVIDGLPYELSFESGTLTDGKVYSRYLNLPAGVHRYYFVATVNGREIRFPKYTDRVGPYVGQPLIVYDLGYSSSGFTTSGTRNDWQYGIPTNVGPISVPYGTNCWATRISDNYRDSSSSRLITPQVDLTNISSPYLRILHWYSFQSTDNLIGHDGGNVKAILPGDTLVILYPPRNYDGQISSYNLFIPYQQGFIDNDNGNSWHYDVFDISHLIGRRVSFYFDFGSSSRNNDAGWYINRVELFGLTSTSADENQNTDTFLPVIELFPPYPNPFNSTTNFTLIARPGERFEIIIYNILGHIIWGESGRVSKETSIVSWNGKDKHGSILPSGIYLYKINCGGRNLYGKVVLLR